MPKRCQSSPDSSPEDRVPKRVMDKITEPPMPLWAQRLETAMNALSNRVDDRMANLERKITDLEARVITQETLSGEVSAQINPVSDRVWELEREIEGRDSMIYKMGLALSRFQYQQAIDGQQARKNNIRVYDLPVGTGRDEGKLVAAEYLQSIGPFAAEGIIRGYRCPKTFRQPVVMCYDHPDRAEKILSEARARGMQDYIKRDYPSGLLDIRAQLYRHKDRLEADGCEVRMQQDTLVVNGTVLTVDWRGELIERSLLRPDVGPGRGNGRGNRGGGNRGGGRGRGRGRGGGGPSPSDVLQREEARMDTAGFPPLPGANAAGQGDGEVVRHE